MGQLLSARDVLHGLLKTQQMRRDIPSELKPLVCMFAISVQLKRVKHILSAWLDTYNL